MSRCSVDRSSTSGSAEACAAVSCVRAGVSSEDTLPSFFVVNAGESSSSSLSTESGRPSSRRLPSAVWSKSLVRRRAVSSLDVDRRRQPSRCRETAVRLPTNSLVSCFRSRPAWWTVVPGTSSLSGAVVRNSSRLSCRGQLYSLSPRTSPSVWSHVRTVHRTVRLFFMF